MPELIRPIRPDLGPFTPEEVRVRHVDPDLLLLDAECEYCVSEEECPAAATIGWSDLDDRSGVVINAGRPCIESTIGTALSTGSVSRVTVSIPLWTVERAAQRAEVTGRQLLEWTAAGHLVQENGRVLGVAPLFAADQIDRARWLGRLTRRGLALQPASQLLRYRDLVEQIVDTLPEIGALTHA